MCSSEITTKYYNNFPAILYKPVVKQTSVINSNHSLIPNVLVRTLKTDKRGRLCLKKADLFTIGITTYCFVSVGSFYHSYGFVKNDIDFDDLVLIRYKVDKDGNVRIPSKVLRKLGITSPTVKVTVYSDKIQLSGV